MRGKLTEVNEEQDERGDGESELDVLTTDGVWGRASALHSKMKQK